MKATEWVYKVEIKHDHPMTTEDLNKLGAFEWELVSHTATGDFRVVHHYIFKKPRGRGDR